MTKIIQEIHFVARRIFIICAGPPYRYWSVFVGACAILFIAVVLFDFFIYWSATKQESIDFSGGIQKELRQIDEDALLRASAVFNEKEARLEYVRERLRYDDPSL